MGGLGEMLMCSLLAPTPFQVCNILSRLSEGMLTYGVLVR